MHNRFFYILFLLVTVINENVFGQINLVPNASFEEYASDCPVNFHDVPLGWYWWRESPNCFSTCVEPQDLSDSLGWAPWTGFGTQQPYDGESFLGLYAFSPYPKPGIPPEYREYLGCQLLEPMIVDSLYHVSFRTSMGFIGNYYWITWACDKLGAIFTTEGDYDWQENPFPVPNFAHVYSDDIITDTTNWISIDGTFVADQPYTHMALGVFFEFSLLDTMDMVLGFNGLGAYYFIDGVSVQMESITSLQEESNLNEIQVLPNPAGQVVSVQSVLQMQECLIMDSHGRVIVRMNATSRNLSIDVSSFAQGIYFVQVKTAKGLKMEKLVVVH